MKCIIALIIVALSDFMTGAWESGPRCPSLLILNGRVRTRSRGKIVRFTCFEGYTLVGNKYSTCIRGRWDTPIPVCVNSACPAPPQPEHSLVATQYNGAISIYFCEPGYVLVGTAEIYCNGRKWNATAPYCRDSSAAAPTSCDFEKGDLCWWEQDPTHDFDWERHNHDTPSSHIGTGPSHDHTLGPGYDGYYLYIEASGRLVNDTARIISPLYNASLTETGCFSFWYHMYGATIGSLRVYFKPERNSSQLMFKKDGNQGNRWLRGTFNLPTISSNTSFQIVIEGVRGASYVSDMAVDDVAILQGDECNALLTATSSLPEVPGPNNDDEIEIVNALQSCRGRCGSGPPSPDAPATILPPGSPDACQCDVDCAQTSICCPDFAEYCVLGATDWVTKNFFETTTPRIGSITTKKDEKPSLPKKPISISPKDDIDPYAKVTIVFETTTAMTNKTTPTTTITKNNTTTQKPLTTRMKLTTRKKINVTSITIPKETPIVVITKVWNDAHVTARTEAHVRADETTVGQLGSPMSLGMSGISIIVGVVIAVTIVLTTIVAYVIIRKRKSYKRGAGGRGSALSEDSDVRFLTSDEILDFNLARPTDDDEL